MSHWDVQGLVSLHIALYYRLLKWIVCKPLLDFGTMGEYYIVKFFICVYCYF